MTNSQRYKVLWSEDAELALKGHKKFINVKLAYKNSFSMLSRNPHDQREGIVDWFGFEFNGYYWVNINNAILFYRVDDDCKTIFIEGCDSALTGEALQKYYGEHDPWTEDED
jgi:hypothetical protein